MDATKVKVRDLMQRDIARLEAATPMHEAVKLLESDRVSGAPVVDGAGRVVGVISMTDVARAQESEDRTIGSPRGEYYLPAEGIDEEADEFTYKEDYSPEALSSGTVAEWMTDQVVSVEPGDSSRVACNRMREHRIHRVLVLEKGKLVGVLSSFDVVSWIAEHG